MTDFKTTAVRDAVVLWKALSDFANDPKNVATVVRKKHVLLTPQVFALETLDDETSHCPFCFFDRVEGNDDCRTCLGANLGFPTDSSGKANCNADNTPFDKFDSARVSVNHEGCNEMFKMTLLVADHHQVFVDDLL